MCEGWKAGSSSVLRPLATAKDVVNEPVGLSAGGFLCPCSSCSTPEPSFPQYLDVLAPYVNQVNLIRAGVPKIVSRLQVAPSPCLEALGVGGGAA